MTVVISIKFDGFAVKQQAKGMHAVTGGVPRRNAPGVQRTRGALAKVKLLPVKQYSGLTF
jgi:hypothetical protein